MTTDSAACCMFWVGMARSRVCLLMLLYFSNHTVLSGVSFEHVHIEPQAYSQATALVVGTQGFLPKIQTDFQTHRNVLR